MRRCALPHAFSRLNIRLFWFVLALLFTSCFEAVEELTFSSPGKGSYKFTFNGSQSKIRLDNLLKLDTFMGRNIPSRSDLYLYASRLRITLTSTPGIRKVNVEADLSNYIFSASFHFDSVQALNNAIANGFRETVPGSSMQIHNLFHLETGKFSRIHHPVDSTGNQAKSDKELDKLLKQASFTSVFRFLSPVSSVDSKNARISKSGKAVMIKHNVSELIENPNILLHSISLK